MTPHVGQARIGVLLLFLLLALSCEDKYRKLLERKREKGESVRLSNFSRQSVLPNGKTEWILHAEEAYLYKKEETQSKIIAYNFLFEQFDTENGKKTGQVTAEKGEVNYEEQKLFLEGNAEFRESDARVILAESMNYDMENGIITSDSLVTIKEGSRVTVCNKGVMIDRENEREICKSPRITQIQKSGKEEEGMDDLFH